MLKTNGLRIAAFGVAIAIAGHAAAGPSTAQEVQVGGNANVTASVTGAQTIVQVGSNNRGRNSVGTVYEGTSVKGNLNVTAKLTGAQTVVQVGSSNTGQNDIGSIGASKN